MKKLLFVVMGILLISTLCAQTKMLDASNAYYIYLNGSGTTLTEDEYLNYAISFEYQTYKKYRNDEFEWEEQFSLIKEKCDEAIKEADFDSVYTVNLNIEFGDYDFTNEGYVVTIGEGTFIPLSTPSNSYYADWKSMFNKKIALKLDSFDKFNFIAMPKEEAKAFLQGRKNSYGSINRSITLQIKYKIAAFDSPEYKNFENLALSNGYLPIVGIIESIDVYDTSNSRNVKKIGELTQN